MKEISTDELKKLQLDILLKVHDFCEKNSLHYFLGYGTLIGALRHKGYIPWDDDIDIGMPRPDYDKLVKTFNGVYPNYYLLAPELNWDYYAPYANVCDNRTLLFEGLNGHRKDEVGVKIDIFPIDGVPEDFEKYKKNRELSDKYNYILEVKRQKLSLHMSFNYNAKLILHKIRNICYSYAQIQRRLHDMVTQYDYNSSLYADKMTFLNPGFTRVKKKVFDEYIDVDFEGYKLKSIKDYDEYMTKIYGDYISLPPEEDRVPHHGFTAYWKDEFLPKNE